MDAAYDEHAAFRFDFANRLGDQSCIRSIDLTRLQRASKGSGQSASGCRYDVIERGGMRFEDIFWHLVVFGHGTVHAKCHWHGFRGQICQPHRTLESLNPDFRTIRHFTHPSLYL
jgi:hypothetical protein